MGSDPIKVYDARWQMDEFDDNDVRRLFDAIFAYARLLDVDTVTMTRDARIGCAPMMELGLEAARAAGLRTIVSFAPMSTPQSYFLTLVTSQRFPQTLGLTLTASHNPKDYVGLKVTVPVVRAIGLDCGPLGGLTKVRELYHSPQPSSPESRGTWEVADVTSQYVDYSLAQAGVQPGSLQGLRVVLDAFHGSAGPELCQVLGKAGVEVVSLRVVPDGEFPSGSPNPTSQGKMDRAVALAKASSAQCVVGIDGDGDRIVFGDQFGILTAGFAFIPILSACLASTSEKTPTVLYDPKVSPLALRSWSQLGSRPRIFRNGHSQIKDYMCATGALAAAEESGHYYHRLTLGEHTVSAENSALTILLFLKALKQDPKLMSQLWEQQRQIVTTGEFNYQFDSDATRDEALSAVVEHFVRQGATTATQTPDGIDLQGTCLACGVREHSDGVELEEGYYSGYLRVATNEKAVVRSYFSAGELETGRRVEAEARRILEEQYTGKVID